MKYALVTGGTRGIGLAVCKLLVQNGYCVTALYSGGRGLEEAKETVPEAEFVCADVADEDAVKAVFERLKRLDLLVNNAGIAYYSQVQDASFAEFRRVTDVNIGGAFLCTKYAVKKMLANGGAIVNISSVWGETGGSCESVYSASKGAVIAFTKAVSKELAPSGITVNCVSPGVVDTEMNAHLSIEEKAALAREIPLGRMGSAEEIAAAVLFFANAKYVTGQVLGVNGGFYI